MRAAPWYAAGLRFSCQRCGACCTGTPGYVWVRPGEAAALAALLGVATDHFLSRHTRRALGGVSLKEQPDGRCEFYEPGKGCRVYAARPRQCRTWPFWERVVATQAAWEREAASCPGMGSGDLVGAGEIDRLACSPAGAGPSHAG